MPVVALINSNADTVEMLRLTLQEYGFESVTAHIDDIKRGSLDFPRLLREHDPWRSSTTSRLRTTRTGRS